MSRATQHSMQSDGLVQPCEYLTNHIGALSNKEAAVGITAPKRDSYIQTATKLINPGLALKPSHISNDVIDIRSRHPLDLRHVAELPMVRADAMFSRPLEGDIGVMIRFVNLMHQRRTLLRPHSSYAMTGGTVGCKLRLTDLNICRSRIGGRLARFWIRGPGLAGGQYRYQEAQSGAAPPYIPFDSILHILPYRGASGGGVTDRLACD